MKSYWSGCVSPREASITFRTFTVKNQIWSKLCGMGELTVQVLEALPLAIGKLVYVLQVQVGGLPLLAP